MLHKSFQCLTGTILVVDDQAANRELLDELLTTQGFKVIAVPDGASAPLELTRTQFGPGADGCDDAQPQRL
jgi:CheY-like chemotaxis protein